MGAIEDSLAGKNSAERNDIKVRALATLTGEVFTRGRFTLTILLGPRVTIIKNVPVLEVMVAVTRDGIPLKIDGHLRFLNPPVKVPDGTTTAVIDPLTGELRQQPNYVENPRAALRQMILDAILVQKP